jgi:hypothetical protein
MLVFIVPLKSQQISKSWYRVCQLFERCIRSICNQTISDFRAIVVCHEKPRIDFTHPNITYLEVDYSVPDAQDYIKKNTDKGRKILTGLIYAKRFNPTHTMVVDSDDCVSRNLAAFVKQNPQHNGWFVRQGYKYREDRHRQYIYLKNKNFYRMCGTCNILRYDLNFLPQNPEYNRGYGYYKYYIDHGKVLDTLAEKGIFLKPLPFAGAIYVLGHGDNNTDNQTRLSFNWLSRRGINNSICQEFSFYNLDEAIAKPLSLVSSPA